MTVKITYTGGRTMISSGWTPGRLELLRASWAQITPPSKATIEIISEDDQEERQP